MLKQLIQNEWLLWRRDNRYVWLLGIIVLMSLLALCFGVVDARKKIAQRQSAQEASRKAWLVQGEKHPHMAAHFGNYAYKHPSVLSVFDPGITAYTGTSVYLEPHRQNDFLLSESGERDTGARFGWFTPSFICQFIIPLLIILLTFNIVVSEKEGGTYSMLLAQGVSSCKIIYGKAAASFILFAAFITAYLFVVALVSSLAIESSTFQLSSFGYLWLCYLLYYATWCLLGVAVSALVKSAGASISILLLFWMLTSIVLPKWAASAGENIHPLTTNYAFKKKVAEDIANGLNGHDVQSERAKRIQDSVLIAEGVDSVQHLNFNFEGYVMQQGEEYSSKVYDVHFGGLYNTLQAQRKVQSLFSIGSPLMMVRNISMAAAGTSLETELFFQQQAEAYRRSFVQTMNQDMMTNSTYGDWDKYKVKNSLYGAIPDFAVPQKPLGWRLSYAGIEQAGMLLWLLLMAGAVYLIAQKNYL